MTRACKPRLVVVAGPTASGKTACAAALCLRLGGEVVSADSMQVYRGMDILTAMPSRAEMRGVPHHMLGIADPGEKFTAAMYRDRAKAVIADIRARGAQPVVCGGTGLYIDALTKPMRFSEESDERLHAELLALAEAPGGRRRLHEMLAEVDPESAARLHENDVRRVARAVEVYRLAGVRQSEQSRQDALGEGDYDERIFALDWPRDALYRRIERRVDAMLAAGLIDEVRRLSADASRYPTASQAIGYKEIAAALAGRTSMDEAVAKVKQATRNFAKRQLTWFRRDPRTVWIQAADRPAEEIAAEIADHLKADGQGANADGHGVQGVGGAVE